MSRSETGAIPAIDVLTAGQLLGFPCFRDQSEECSADTNLLTQIAPLIASMSCQLRILNLLKPLIDVVKGLPNPSPQAIEEFTKAAAALVPCFEILTPTGVLPFLRSLLCLEIRSLNCFLHNLRAITSLAGATPSAVAASEVRSVLDSYPPIVGILDLASDFFGIAGLNIPRAPTLARGTDPGSLDADQGRVAAFTATLQMMADTLGGCQ